MANRFDRHSHKLLKCAAVGVETGSSLVFGSVMYLYCKGHIDPANAALIIELNREAHDRLIRLISSKVPNIT